MPVCKKPVKVITLHRSFPPQAGMYYINHWIPACAGMTMEGIDTQAIFVVILAPPSFQRKLESRERGRGG